MYVDGLYRQVHMVYRIDAQPIRVNAFCHIQHGLRVSIRIDNSLDQVRYVVRFKCK